MDWAQGGVPAGFDVTGASIPQLNGLACDTGLYTVDVNGDGKVDLLVVPALVIDGTQMVPLSSMARLFILPREALAKPVAPPGKVPVGVISISPLVVLAELV